MNFTTKLLVYCGVVGRQSVMMFSFILDFDVTDVKCIQPADRHAEKKDSAFSDTITHDIFTEAIPRAFKITT